LLNFIAQSSGGSKKAPSTQAPKSLKRGTETLRPFLDEQGHLLAKGRGWPRIS
jgi:hypothetical protein